MAREMKNSGVEWIGDIPAEWEMKRLKAIFLERKEKNDPQQTDFILSLGAAYGVVPYSEKEGGGNKAKEDLTAYRLAYPDDIVMNSMNIISGSVGISKYFGCVSPVYYMLYPRTEGVNQHYYCQMFQTKEFQRSLLGLGNGILMKETESGNFNTVRMRIPMEKLGVQLLPVPPYEEQKRIADFLDRTCAEIDTVIEKTKATIEEYKKLKQSVITEAVTKGIRGDRDMKDSGVEWIGNIPAEWELVRLKVLFGFGKGLPITKENLIEAGSSVISYGQIHSKTNTGIDIKPDLIRYVSEDYLTSNPQSLVNFGDFIFADTSEDLEGCGNNIYVDSDRQLFAGYHTITLCSLKKTDNSYLAYLFKTDCWRSQIRSKVSGVKLFSISKKILSETTVLLPKEQEQKEIVTYLNSKCAEIDKLIADKTHLLEEMEIYKKSVIFEYVTGKKEIV